MNNMAINCAPSLSVTEMVEDARHNIVKYEQVKASGGDKRFMKIYLERAYMALEDSDLPDSDDSSDDAQALLGIASEVAIRLMELWRLEVCGV